MSNKNYWQTELYGLEYILHSKHLLFGSFLFIEQLDKEKDKYNIVINTYDCPISIDLAKLFKAKNKKRKYKLAEAIVTVEKFVQDLEKMQSFI